ncbi:MAG TPA: archease [Dehalococcoidia bacterium]
MAISRPVYNRHEGVRATPQPPFEQIEHTADAGIIAHGATLAELFKNAAAGMFALMVAPGTVRDSLRREVTVEARDVEGLLVAWLAELLFYVDAEELLFGRFDVHAIDDQHIAATVFGEPIDRARHELRLGVKAVTRHMLDVSREPDGYRATVLFDI